MGKSDFRDAEDQGQGVDSVLGLSEITENKSIWKMLIAEFLGTLILVTVGCGSVVALTDTDSNNSHIIQIGLTFGLTVATLAQCIGHISGCHVNPAVTVSLFVTGDIKLVRTVLFVVVQCLGAMAGSALLRVMTPEDKVGTLGMTSLSPQISPLQGFLMESILTFLLLFVIHAVCDGRRKDIGGSIALSIGLAITACHLSGIQYTGSSINPARTFGPAVVMNLWENHWVYWAGPMLGGIVAGIIYKFIFKVQKESDSYDF